MKMGKSRGDRIQPRLSGSTLSADTDRGSRLHQEIRGNGDCAATCVQNVNANGNQLDDRNIDVTTPAAEQTQNTLMVERVCA